MNQLALDSWYEPDPTWPALGFVTRESYVGHMVEPGVFHAEVHEDVVKSYRTAAHLMALAWYHYPMYDEALKKLTGIMEMAVKLRCQQKGIALTVGVDKPRNKPLVQLIDELCVHPEATDLKERLHWARRIRNFQAHPEHHSFGGIAMSPAIKPLVSILNLLFRC
jgi:hypothetical protein